MTFYSPVAVPMKIKGPMLDALDHILAASVGGIVTAFAGNIDSTQRITFHLCSQFSLILF
jgi:hypothetical protein